jgi:hypothetical protein
MISGHKPNPHSFYSDVRSNSAVSHDKHLLRLHVDHYMAPTLSPMLGFPVMPLPTLQETILYVQQHDYLRFPNTEAYKQEITAAIKRRYGATLSLWTDYEWPCRRCNTSFRWADSVGRWQCRRHPGVQLDATARHWSCCVNRNDMSLNERYRGCMPCDHYYLGEGGGASMEPDVIRMPVVLLNFLRVRRDALAIDCRAPWVPRNCIDPATGAPPPLPRACHSSHVYLDTLFDASLRAELHAAELSPSDERCCMLKLNDTSKRVF